MDWWIWLLFWVIGAMIMLGVRGGIHDEMDGIADLFAVFAWPIWVGCKIIFYVAGVFVNLGIQLRRLFN